MLPTAEEILERAHVVALPMAVRFRGITTREALLIDGPAGWGEFAPFIEYGPKESAAWLRAGIEAAFEGLPEATGRVEVNGTVPAVPVEQVEAVLARYPQGVSTFKIKVAEPGQSLADDTARLARVHTLRPDARLRVDANRAWSVAEACAAIAAFARIAELEYVEQPCGSAEELAEVRRRVDTPIAADESIRRASDPYRVAELQAADVAVVKPAPLGGVRRVLEVAQHLRQRHMDITVASALDTSIGINMGLAAVAALPRIYDDEDIDVTPAAAGLATGSLFEEDVTAPRPLVDGHLPADILAPDPDRLAALAAPADRRDWWFDRVRACWPHLAD